MSGSELKLLYIEADDFVRASVVTLLESLECAITKATNFKTAINELDSQTPFDLILLGDITRPSTSTSIGPKAELTIIAKTRSLYPKTPLLIFTNHNYLPAAYEYGITAHLLKPADQKAIIRFITPHLEIMRPEKTNDKSASQGSK